MRVPQLWRDEMAKGTVFGQRVAKTIQSGGRNTSSRPAARPDVSTIGTQLQNAFETAIGKRISCGTCLQFFRSLNKTTEHDHAIIVDRITAEMPIPIEIRRQYPRTAARREWVRSIVVPIVPQTIEAASMSKSDQLS